MNKVIEEHKHYIRNCMKGFDATFGAKKTSLTGILNDIDADTSIQESEIHRRYNVFYNLTLLNLRRKKRGSNQADWLISNSEMLLRELYLYRRLNDSVIRVDDSLYKWSQTQDIGDYMLNTDLSNYDEVLFMHNDTLYSVSVNSNYVEIQLLTSSSEKVPNPSYSLIHKKDVDSLKVICNNDKCPRWSQSFNKPYNDNSRECNCSVSDCQKCGFFEKTNRLEPMKALDFANIILYILNSREYSNEGSKRDDYEHLPMPQREDDVVIYYGGTPPKKHDRYPKEINDSGIVRSHASPREHTRRGTMRYNPKTGEKDIKVKGCVVNKGHTKTSYILKERQSK